MPTKSLKFFLWIYMVIMVFAGIHIYGIALKANGDNVEHLHTSWQVWRGYMPYRDFFQHHNPLMWYLSAPLVALLIDNPNIFSIFNIIGVIVLCLIAYALYKILRFSKAGENSSMFMAAITVSSYSLLWSTDYRPDTFMFVFFFYGLYALLLYVNKPKFLYIFLSFLSFFISFMFTQKVMMHLVVPGIAVLYWLYTGKIKISKFCQACFLPIVLLLLFVGYLYCNDALMVYWKSNFPFNTYIPKIFEEQRIIFPPREYIDFYIFLPFGTIASIYFLYKGSAIERIFSLMFWFETVLRFFYFSAFLHYVIFWLMTAMVLTVMLMDKLTVYKKYFAGLGVLYLLFMLFYNYYSTYYREVKPNNFLHGHELAFNVLTPCDYAINGYYATYNLKAKDPGYYAILLGQIDVLGEKSGIAKRDDLNKLILEKKPKIVSAGVYWDTYWEQRGKKIPAHTIDSYLLNTYYDYSGIGDIHILKPQFQKRICVYNGKEWKFMD